MFKVPKNIILNILSDSIPVHVCIHLSFKCRRTNLISVCNYMYSVEETLLTDKRKFRADVQINILIHENFLNNYNVFFLIEQIWSGQDVLYYLATLLVDLSDN